MENFVDFIKTDNFIIISTIINICLFITVLALIIYVYNINKKYINFMKKIGHGNNIDEMLKVYLQEVAEIKKDNNEIKAYYMANLKK